MTVFREMEGRDPEPDALIKEDNERLKRAKDVADF